MDCENEYIKESSKTFVERFKQHLKPHSSIYDHYNITGHDTSVDSFSIMEREEESIARSIKEAIFIWVNDSSLNRNIVKYQLPHMWDEVLINPSELKLIEISMEGHLH